MTETRSRGFAHPSESSSPHERTVTMVRHHLHMSGRRFIVGLAPNQLPDTRDLRAQLVHESFWSNKKPGISVSWVRDEFLTAAADEAARRLLGEKSGLDGEDLDEEKQRVINQAAKGFRSIFEAALDINQPRQAKDYGTSTVAGTPDDSPTSAPERGQWLNPHPNPHREQPLRPNPFDVAGSKHRAPHIDIGARNPDEGTRTNSTQAGTPPRRERPLQLNPFAPGTPDQRATHIVARYPGEDDDGDDSAPIPPPPPKTSVTMETPVGQNQPKKVIPIPTHLWDAYRTTPSGRLARQFTPRDVDPDEENGGEVSESPRPLPSRPAYSAQLQPDRLTDDEPRAVGIRPNKQLPGYQPEANNGPDLGEDYSSLPLREKAERLHEIFDISNEEAERMATLPQGEYALGKLPPRRMPAD